MKDYEIVYIANYILEYKLTVRSAGEVFQIPKSTLHYNLTKKLKKINYTVYLKLHKYFENNFNEKHIRGGIATKEKYKKIHHKK